MDDLIPFLIVIAISIIGAVTRKKKKRAVFDSIAEPEPTNQQDDFFGWMERVVDPKPEPKPFGVEEYVEEMDAVEEHAKPTYDSASHRPEQFAKYSGFISPAEKEEMMKKEGATAIVKSPVDDLTTPSIKDEEIGKEKVNFDFDLKKAVIFSTLLNRKYS
ncbi:MAG: hypothetical protein ACERKD_13015 [Prolixibacteraceae bacterium]